MAFGNGNNGGFGSSKGPKLTEQDKMRFNKVLEAFVEEDHRKKIGRATTYKEAMYLREKMEMLASFLEKSAKAVREWQEHYDYICRDFRWKTAERFEKALKIEFEREE